MFFLVVTASFRAWQERQMREPGTVAPSPLDDPFTLMLKSISVHSPQDSHYLRTKQIDSVKA